MNINYLFLQMMMAIAASPAIAADGTPSPAIAAAYPTPDGEAMRGIHIDQLAKTVLPEYKLQERRLSEAGIGYHYLFKGRSSDVVITAAAFATAGEAQRAAELSHRLMPVKPNNEKGIGDQAWIWDDPRGTAVRFRLGRCLIRIAGKLKIEECRSLARHFARQLAADATLVEDVRTNDAPRLRILGFSGKMKIGQTHKLEIILDNSSKANPFVTGIWVSEGSISPARKPNNYAFSAGGSPRTITVRCFAIFDDNVAIVETRQVDLVKDR